MLTFLASELEKIITLEFSILHPGIGMIQDSVGYRLPLVTRILVSGLLPVTTGYHNLNLRVVPVTTGYQNFRIRVVTGYNWLPLFRSQIGYRLPLVTKFDDLDRFPSVANF